MIGVKMVPAVIADPFQQRSLAGHLPDRAQEEFDGRSALEAAVHEEPVHRRCAVRPMPTVVSAYISANSDHSTQPTPWVKAQVRPAIDPLAKTPKRMKLSVGLARTNGRRR